MNIFRNDWRTNRDIIIELGLPIYLDISKCLYQQKCYIIDEVIWSKNISKFEKAKALLIFELEYRSKSENVTNIHCYPPSIFNFRYPILVKKGCRDLKMAAILKIPKYVKQSQCCIRYEEIIWNYVTTIVFWWWHHPLFRKVASKSSFYIPFSMNNEHIS